jgi:hypothetical protein
MNNNMQLAVAAPSAANEVYDRIAEPISAIAQLGEWISSSGMFGCTKVEQGHIIAMQCLAEKKSPFDIKRTYHLVNGQPTMRADAMLAGYRARGGKVIWKQFDAKVASATWKYDGNEIDISYSLDDAKAAGLYPGKPGSGWQKDPAAMLRARLISKAIRMIAPEVVMGIYTPEEAQDFGAEAPRVTVAKVDDSAVIGKLETLFEAREEEVNAFLISTGKIKEGQNFRDLPTDVASKVISKPDLILSKLPKIETAEVVG